MNTRIVTFHNGNLNPELLQMQKAVFDKFEIPLEQIETSLPHPEAIDHFLEHERFDVFVLFDADCIPLNKEVVSVAVRGASVYSMYAAAQKASHIPGSKIYASPCFMAFSKNTYEGFGRPSFKATERGDVAEEMSYAAREKRFLPYLLFPSHVEFPMWDLDAANKFGYGTTYDNMVYHAFESNANHNSTKRFIEKCQEVLNAS